MDRTRLSVDDLEAIRLAMTEYDCKYWGIRIIPARDFDPSEALRASRKWVDGSPTDERLGGTSAVAVDENGKPLADLRGYFVAAGPGCIVMLIGGDEAVSGEDEGELLISEAYCYWHKMMPRE